MPASKGDDVNKEVTAEVSTEEAVQPPYNPRQIMMDEAIKSAKDIRENERNQYKLDTGIDPDAQMNKEAAERLEELEQSGEIIKEIIDESAEILDEEIVDKSSETDTIQDVKQEEPAFLTLNVNGKEVSMTKEEATAKLQQDVHAQNLMREAVEMKNKAAQPAQPAPHTTPPDDASQAVDEEALKKALNGFYDGEPDDLAQFLVQNLKTSQPAISTNEVVEIIDKRVAEKADFNDLQTSYQRFMKDDKFKSIAQDDFLLKRLDAATLELKQDAEFMATSPNYDDFFQEAGKRTLAWVAKLTPTPEVTESEVDERIERKRTLATSPAKRLVRRGPKVETRAAPPSREDIVREMARKRGQSNF